MTWNIMHQVDIGLAGVMAHKFGSPRARICQNSAVHCGLMFFIHFPKPCCLCSVPVSVYVVEWIYACNNPSPCVSPLLTLSVQRAVLKTIFFLINHINTMEQLWSRGRHDA